MTSSEPESVEVDEKNIAALDEKARGGRSCNSISIETFECALNTESNGADLSAGNCEVDKVPFFCGNRHIENTEGILHIYKPNEKLGDREKQQEEIDPNNPGFVASRIQCMLGVPAAMTSQNVLDFLAPFSESLMHIRFLRDSDPNSFMVLLKFKDEPSSMECYSYLNGRPFNSIEPDLCHLVFVSRVEVVRTSKGGSLPAAGYAEMPKCIVCLERLDETVLGLLTVPCNHSFHAACMKHWSDTTCPVCRHLITPGFTESQSCPVCGKRDDLWICLICGHVGCGRYANGHAYQHFQETQHTFALEVGGQRVWDYAGDNYVHRLIQSKSDGKLVEFNPGNNSIEATEKVEALNLEYSYLLSREMDAQRKYYEDRLTEFQEGAYIKISALEKEVGIIKENSEATRRLLRNVTTEKHNLEQKLTLAKSKAEELMKLYREELELNSCLRRNQSDYSQKLNALQEELATLRQTKDKEIEALKDEVRDLMIHIESAARLAREDEATTEEIRQGHVFVPEESRSTDQTSRRRTRGRRNRR